MSKEVTVEELPERIDDVVAAIDAGETVTIVRDGRTIANVTPTIVQRGIKYPFRDLKITPLERPLDVDVVALIREDRDTELRRLDELLPRRPVNIIRHDPALRLQDFKPSPPIHGTGSEEWLIGERDRDRSGKKHRP